MAERLTPYRIGALVEARGLSFPLMVGDKYDPRGVKKKPYVIIQDLTSSSHSSSPLFLRAFCLASIPVLPRDAPNFPHTANLT